MTAMAVETKYPSDERIRFVGKKLADRLRESGLTWGMLAEDWNVSLSTARNTAYWPSPKAVPPAERVEALELAAGLPVGTLLDQYYVERIDPSYWAGEPETEPEPEAEPTTRKPPTKMKTPGLKVAPAPQVKPVIVVEPIPDDALCSPLRRRLIHLERVLIAVAPLIAEAAGVDADQLLAEMGIEG